MLPSVNPYAAPKSDSADSSGEIRSDGGSAKRLCFGWLAVFIVPQISFLFLTIKADFTVRKLQGLQRQLIEEWGEGVKGEG